jgi:Protein of unknown function (DUF1329)
VQPTPCGDPGLDIEPAHQKIYREENSVRVCLNLRYRGPFFLIAALCALLMVAGASYAAANDAKGYTRSTIDQWLSKYTDAKPDFKPGDVLTSKDLERVRPFIPPGYFEQLQFPEFTMRIAEARSHTPRRDYMECTEKYQAQVTPRADGSLANYLCGQPFPNDALRVSDPSSGIKAAWNFDYRWQNYGQFSLNYLFVFDKFGGSHTGQLPKDLETPPQSWVAGVEYHSKLPADISGFLNGGGTFTRIISSFYRRVYFSHLAQRAAEGGLLGTSDSAEFLWKEFTGFFSPYDVRGQVFITYRYADPHHADDAWAYDPQSRRVRRVSVEVKSDSVAGTDTTEEDFYSFSGRPLHWRWKFLGWKDVLAVLDSKYDYAHLFGPNGDVPNDFWTLRRFAVVERIPTEANHPYSSVVMFWDAQNYHPWISIAFDCQRRFWKIWDFQSRWSEDFVNFAEINHGAQSDILTSESVIDVQNDRATIFAGYGVGYPDATPASVKQLYDISKLEEMHR